MSVNYFMGKICFLDMYVQYYSERYSHYNPPKIYLIVCQNVKRECLVNPLSRGKYIKPRGQSKGVESGSRG